MAKLERTLQGDFEEIVDRIENGIMKGSLSASLEDASDFTSGRSRCAIRVFERYSWLGGNRVSMSVTLFEGEDGLIRLSAITSGGSQAMFFKINTFGEDAITETTEALSDMTGCGTIRSRIFYVCIAGTDVDRCGKHRHSEQRNETLRSVG